MIRAKLAYRQTLYDSWIIVLFNIVFTSLPIILVGLWDRYDFFAVLGSIQSLQLCSGTSHKRRFSSFQVSILAHASTRSLTSK